MIVNISPSNRGPLKRLLARINANRLCYLDRFRLASALGLGHSSCSRYALNRRERCKLPRARISFGSGCNFRAGTRLSLVRGSSAVCEFPHSAQVPRIAAPSLPLCPVDARCFGLLCCSYFNNCTAAKCDVLSTC